MQMRIKTKCSVVFCGDTLNWISYFAKDTCVAFVLVGEEMCETH